MTRRMGSRENGTPAPETRHPTVPPSPTLAQEGLGTAAQLPPPLAESRWCLWAVIAAMSRTALSPRYTEHRTKSGSAERQQVGWRTRGTEVRWVAPRKE